ncbi:MAG: hypothetical protein ABLT11_04175 [Candidatus Acidiferrum sp.]
MNNPGRSQFPSIKLDQLVYVELEASNGGMMLTVSEDGFTFRAVTPVEPGRKIGFSFVVNGTEKLGGYGNIDWTQDGGKVASLQFDDVTPEFRSALRKWLTQLSAPAVPSFSNDHFIDPGFGEQRAAAPARASVEPVADPFVEPAKAPSLSEFVSAASPLSSIAGLADQSNAAVVAPEPPTPRETFLLSDWEYPRQPQADSRPRIRGAAIAAIIIVVVALTVILYGYHDSVGQLLISLGQKMSAPKEVSAAPPSSAPQTTSASQTTAAPTPLKVPDVPKRSVESPQPASAATRENTPGSPEKGLSDQRRYRTENTSESVKPQTTAGAVSPAPATSTSAAQIEDPAERVHSLWVAVAQGNTSAEVALAKLYLIGGGVTKSCDQARVLLQAAAKKGNGEALDKLSQINQQGCP